MDVPASAGMWIYWGSIIIESRTQTHIGNRFHWLDLLILMSRVTRATLAMCSIDFRFEVATDAAFVINVFDFNIWIFALQQISIQIRVYAEQLLDVSLLSPVNGASVIA